MDTSNSLFLFLISIPFPGKNESFISAKGKRQCHSSSLRQKVKLHLQPSTDCDVTMRKLWTLANALSKFARYPCVMSLLFHILYLFFLSTPYSFAILSNILFKNFFSPLNPSAPPPPLPSQAIFITSFFSFPNLSSGHLHHPPHLQESHVPSAGGRGWTRGA